MNAARLKSLFGIALAASAIAARGSPCGNPCSDSVSVVPLYPDAAPPAGDAGTSASWSPTPAQCSRVCTVSASSCRGLYVAASDGGVVPAIECDGVVCSGSGRRPEGLRAHGHRRCDPTQAWLAECAHLEAASVIAFRRLRAELRTLRAPRSLLRQASRASRDEQRHARTMRALSRRAGVMPEAVNVALPQARSLEALAIENAIEGCVRETFAALLAHRQASAAEDRHVRAAMTKIAVDETRHAAFAWSLDAWAKKRLDRPARARVDAARARAAAELTGGSRACLADARLGLPDGAEACALARRMMSLLVREKSDILRT